MNYWTTLHASVTESLIEMLNSENIRYFILRNYEGLPETNIGKDVDFVIAPGTYHKVELLLLKTLASYNIRFYTTSRFDRMVCWYIFDVKRNFGIHFDFMENESYKGFEFFNFDILYKNTTIYNNMRVLRKNYDVALLLAQNLVAYKALKEKYRIKIQESYHTNKQELKTLIEQLFGYKASSVLMKSLDNDNYDHIVKNAVYFENAFKITQFKRQKFRTTYNILHFLCDRFYRIVWCPKSYQRHIVIEAPDGTGKSTFMDCLISRLSLLYNCDESRFSIHHFRPSILPNLRAISKKVGVMKQDTNFIPQHRAMPSGFISSVIRMSYYWLDYVIGVPYFLRKEVHYERYSIYDHYIYDILIDPYRSRIKLPYCIRLCFTKMVKQPQIIFVLNANPDGINARKQELTLSEIEKQLVLFGNIKNHFNNVYEIDANRQQPEEMVDEALTAILSKFFKHID